MERLPLQWMIVDHQKILKQMQIEVSSQAGGEALAKMAQWEAVIKPRLEGHAGFQVIREPHVDGEPGAVYCAVTLGQTLSSELEVLSQSGRLWEATLLDALADHWLLQAVQHQFEAVSALCRERGWGMTTRRMPGAGYPLAMAGRIIKILDPGQNCLKFIEPGFIEPIKSLAYFYEVVPQGDIPIHDEECAACTRETCVRRTLYLAVDILQGSELQTIQVIKGENLLKTLQEAGVAPDAPCGGRGTCGHCRVEIQADAGERQWVLACKTTVELPMRVWVPAGETWQMAEDPEDALVHEPFLTRVSAEDFFNRKASPVAIQLSALKCVEAMGDAAHQGGFILQDSVIVGYSPEASPLVGAAVDLGSTTIALKLFELETGRMLGTEGFPNPLRVYGSDILSRLTDPSKANAMTQSLRRRLGQALERGLNSGPWPDVIAFAGNNAMAQILLGLDCQGLARAPYRHWLHGRTDLTAGDFWPERSGVVTVLPGVSPFTGGDLTAGIIHCGIHETRLKTLYLDLGTNGEMALGNSEGITVTAAAAGSAFESLEGAGGIGAVHGAVRRVQCLGSNGWHLETIGGKPPVGLCGSGMISLMAELLRYGFIGSDGTLDEAEDGNLHLTDRISVTQKDIRSFQLAKAAFRAGIEVLLRARGWRADELEQVVIAGGFSRDITPRDLVATGFLPPLDPKVISMAGNACLGGLCDFLLNKEARKGIYNITETMTALNLGEEADFEALFIRHINF